MLTTSRIKASAVTLLLLIAGSESADAQQSYTQRLGQHDPYNGTGWSREYEIPAEDYDARLRRQKQQAYAQYDYAFKQLRLAEQKRRDASREYWQTFGKAMNRPLTEEERQTIAKLPESERSSADYETRRNKFPELPELARASGKAASEYKQWENQVNATWAQYQYYADLSKKRYDELVAQQKKAEEEETRLRQQAQVDALNRQIRANNARAMSRQSGAARYNQFMQDWGPTIDQAYRNGGSGQRSGGYWDHGSGPTGGQYVP